MLAIVQLIIYLTIVIDLTNGENINLIDKSSKIKNFTEKQWFLDNIPFIEIPDKTIEDVYYYRWSSHKRHLVYVTPGTGYIVTEFTNDPGYWRFGFIRAAAAHQMYESRWMRDQKYVKDDINFFARQLHETGEDKYTDWVAYATWHSFLVNGDKQFLISQLEGLINRYNDFSNHFESTLGLYHTTPMWDAQEFSASSVQTKDGFNGGRGYRPSQNSEMHGNSRAIANIAQLKGDHKIETEFKVKAQVLRESIIKYLWDKKRNFFYHMYRENNPNHTLLDTREEVGFFPWRFGVVDDRYNFSLAFDQLFDKQGFGTDFGPSTCEVRSKWYDGEQKPPKCCWWNGNSWPYSTSVVIRSLYTHLHSFSHQNPKISVDNYVSLLHKYALTQYKDNKPYVAECHSPVHNQWVGDTKNRSEHYAHSTYIDNVLIELLGIYPQKDSKLIVDPLIPKSWDYFIVEDLFYHGKNVSIIYDKTGDKYKKGKGLTVYVNGEKKGNIIELAKLTVDVGEVVLPKPPAKRIENYAANPYKRGYPRPYASYTDPMGWVYFALDGRIIYDFIPNNRWTNFGSKHETDWFAVYFGRQKTFDSVHLFVYSDVVTNEGRTDCPTKMVVQYIDEKNEWKDVEKQVSVPSKCLPNDLNRITFSRIKTSQLRVVFTRNTAKDYYVGITEFQVWAEWPQTSYPNTYEAEDGLLTEALMESSSSASSHSYVGSINLHNSSVEIPGVFASKEGNHKIRVFYANADNNTSSHNLVINGLHNIPINYPITHSGWGQFSDKNYVDLIAPLLYGNNVLEFYRDKGFAELDKIQII